MAEPDLPLVPHRVLAAFRLAGNGQPLAGGTVTSVRVGDVVLKPTDDPGGARWLAELLSTLAPDGVRTPQPIRAADGRWVVAGWTASVYLAGVQQRGRWAETVEAGRRLHLALADLPRPQLRHPRTHRWAAADRIAWGTEETVLDGFGNRLLAHRAPLDLPRQLVHCDLAGNVLFHDPESPAVIDLSLYWRPVPYADAVAVVDALLWYDADDEVLDLVDHPDARQLLIRALVFRWASELGWEHGGARTPMEVWQRVARLIG